MNETTRRFLAGVLEQVGDDRLVELRLFPALRQGGIESAVAVIAVEPLRGATVTGEIGQDTSVNGERAGPEAVLPAIETEVEIGARLEERVAGLRGPDGGIRTPPDAFGDREVELSQTHAVADSPPADALDESILLGDLVALPEPAIHETPPAEGTTAIPARSTSPRSRRRTMRAGNSHDRLQILSATYRLVFKGPDRGRWHMEIVHEADAPLETLERVVHGVARRAGDTSEAEFFTADSIRAALAQPVWI